MLGLIYTLILMLILILTTKKGAEKMDRLLLSFIKRAKEQVEKGEASATEYAKSLNEIYQKMNEFNGMTKDEFWKIVEQL